MEKVFKGIAASPGIIIGRAFLNRPVKPRFTYQFLMKTEDVKKELQRFKKAVTEVKSEIKSLKKDLAQKTSLKEIEAILDAYNSILNDPLFFKATLNRIKEEKINAEWALTKTLNYIEEIFGQIEDHYIRNRFQDVYYVANRLLKYLSQSGDSQSFEDPNRILIAHELSPTEITKLPTKKVIGLVTETGGITSHTAIVAQALKMPAVFGIKGILKEVKNGDVVIVDGCQGIVVVNPEVETLKNYQQKQHNYLKFSQELEHYIHAPAKTQDGRYIKVMANVELLEEVPGVLNMGAEGIGLFRTEFFYLGKEHLPSENELYNYFMKVIKAIYPYEVTFRTLDFGGDKLSSALNLTKEINPALGLRAIRLCLKERTIFETQLRALLRASQHGHIRLLIPLISSVEEIYEAKQIFVKLYQQLRQEDCQLPEAIPLGIMIEVPSAVTLIDFLVKEVDFISIGTNDLIQYSLAIDRNNEQVAYLYQPLHPAVLRMLFQITTAAHHQGINVSVCGEMARDPFYMPILVGLGVDEISLIVQNIPLVKRCICFLNHERCRHLVNELLKLPTVAEVKKLYLEYLKQWDGETGLFFQNFVLGREHQDEQKNRVSEQKGTF